MALIFRQIDPQCRAPTNCYACRRRHHFSVSGAHTRNRARNLAGIVLPCHAFISHPSHHWHVDLYHERRLRAGPNRPAASRLQPRAAAADTLRFRILGTYRCIRASLRAHPHGKLRAANHLERHWLLHDSIRRISAGKGKFPYPTRRRHQFGYIARYQNRIPQG